MPDLILSQDLTTVKAKVAQDPDCPGLASASMDSRNWPSRYFFGPTNSMMLPSGSLISVK